jgi:hypothetical protein
MAIPKRIDYGEHKGKVYCTQYACLNNYGLQTGKIHYSDYPSGCCKLEHPRIILFSYEMWGCSDERYGNEIVLLNTGE